MCVCVCVCLYVCVCRRSINSLPKTLEYLTIFFIL